MPTFNTNGRVVRGKIIICHCTYQKISGIDGHFSTLQVCAVNANKISVVCTDYKPFKGETTLKVEAEKPFKLRIVTKYLWYPVELDVPAGTSEFKV